MQALNQTTMNGTTNQGAQTRAGKAGDDAAVGKMGCDVALINCMKKEIAEVKEAVWTAPMRKLSGLVTKIQEMTHLNNVATACNVMFPAYMDSQSRKKEAAKAEERKLACRREEARTEVKKVAGVAQARRLAATA
jgi:hypothetical protein